MTDQWSLFTFKSYLFFCVNFYVKRQLSIDFQAQFDRQTEKQNNTIKVFLLVYCRFEEND